MLCFKDNADIVAVATVLVVGAAVVVVFVIKDLIAAIKSVPQHVIKIRQNIS